jgi:hypothetical protein
MANPLVGPEDTGDEAIIDLSENPAFAEKLFLRLSNVCGARSRLRICSYAEVEEPK